MWFTVILMAFILPTVVADKEDKGLIVSVLPGIFTSGGMESFVGSVDQFSTSDKMVMNWYRHDTDIMDMALNPGNQSAYIMDGFDNGIYKIENCNPSLPDSMKMEEVFMGVSYTIHARVAYDWLAGNLYWSDSKYNWIAIQSKSMQGTVMHAVILHEGLHTPAALAVDPLHYYLFFSENNDGRSFIYRTALDGSEKIVIYHMGYSILDIAVDFDESRIFWIDNTENAILSSDFKGQNMKSVFSKEEHLGFMGSIDVIMDTVVIVEYFYGYILSASKTKENFQKWKYQYGYYDGSPWVARVYDKSVVKQKPTPCDTLGCSQICINKDVKPTCMCADGYVVDPKNPKLCINKTPLYARGILVANSNVNGSEICMVHKSALTKLTSYGLSKCVYNWNATITYMAADANRTLIFFSDKTGIYKLDAIQNITTMVTPVMGVTGLAYDWNTRDIFWSEKSGAIRMMSTALAFPGVIDIYTKLSNPSNLTIDPHNKQLFWISEQTGGEHKIEGGTYGMETIWTLADDTTLDDPKGLYYDVTSRKVFWINSKNVQYMNDDGSNVKVMHSSREDSMLVIFKDYAVQTSGQDDFLVTDIEYENRPSSNLKTPEYTDMTAIAVFDGTMQRKEIGPCEINNGDCEEFCIPLANNRRRCACGNGYVKYNETACTSHPLIRDFALTVDFSHKEIFQINMNDPSQYVAIDIKQPITPYSAAYDMNSETLYWSDIGTNDIRKSTLYGENIKTLYNPGEVVVHTMTIDPSTGLIYFGGDSYSLTIPSFIGVLHPQNGHHIKLIKDLVYAYDVVVFPSEALLFFIDVGFFGENRIGEAKMDGSAFHNLISSSLTRPKSLTLSIPASGKKEDARLYWSDIQENVIYSIKLDKTDKRLIYEDPSGNINHIAVSGAFIYYTTTNKQYITKLSISRGKTEKWMSTNLAFGRLQSLEIYPGDPVPVHRECSVNNGGCSTYCLPSTNTTRVCACEEGVTLMDDYRTCANVKKCSRPIKNGYLYHNCTGYVSKSCGYDCDHGYAKINNHVLTCMDGTPMASWNLNVNNLCAIATTKAPTTTTKKTTPVPTLPTYQPVVMEEGITTPAFISTILALIVVFLIILFVVLFVLHKRRGEKMFAHSKFVNRQSFQMDASEENNYSTLSKHSRGDGMENPLYDAKNGMPKETAYDNTIRQQDQVTLEVPAKF